MYVPCISSCVILHHHRQKLTNLPLKPTFIQNYLEERPFYKYNWDALIVKLSKLYDLVRTRGHPVQGDSSAGGSQSAFVRQTTKYWVIIIFSYILESMFC
jgi:SPX domain protein involved in polyphosphate accumulation